MDSEAGRIKLITGLIIENEENAALIEQEILNLIKQHDETWAQFCRSRSEKRRNEYAKILGNSKERAGRELSRYVFAQMPEPLAIRALKFAIDSPGGGNSCISIAIAAKIVTNFVDRNPKFYSKLNLKNFFMTCLGELTQWGYYGDMEGFFYDNEGWCITRRVLYTIYNQYDTSFLEIVRSILDEFLSGKVSTLKCSGGDFEHAEKIGILKLVVKRLELYKAKT